MTAPTPPQKKVYIKTYGCQMNIYDSQRMEDVLRPLGYDSAGVTAEDADLIILNTCHIREKAAEKVYSELGRLHKKQQRRLQNGGKAQVIAVGGCVAQAEGEEILRRAPYVDIVMGSQSYHHLPRLLADASTQKRGVVELEFPEVQKFDLLPAPETITGASAYVSVQEGCDKFCTFCVVPYTRGAEYSRPMRAVLEEVRTLVETKGVMEVTLLGQNVNAYHGDNGAGGVASLAELAAELSEINGLHRIRYVTSHPRDMRRDLIEAHGALPKLMPYLHLPIQAGSDRILKAMNRKHTAAEYLDIIHQLRAVRPDMAFSGDFIVGFPDETEEDFTATLRVVETVGYASAYSFAYSPRAGTPAATHKNPVAEAEKSRRLEILQALLTRQQEAFNAACIGSVCAVILDRRGKVQGQMLGRSPWMQSVHVENATHRAHEMVQVRITAASGSSLKGELV
jgi:tRNA-2-methylthio-N6-dimethylallyladenosine synthase